MALSRDIKIPNAKKKLKGILKNHIEQIREWMDEGYTKKLIFEHLKQEKVISCSYNHFNQTVNIFLKESKNSSGPVSNKPISTSSIPKKKSFQMMRLDEDDFK